MTQSGPTRPLSKAVVGSCTRSHGKACSYASFKACAMSAIRSDGCSMPIDSRIVESRTPIFLADVSRNSGVGHACWQACKRLGAAEAHRQLEDLQAVQEFECGGLAANNVERERRACPRALPREQTASGGGLFEVSKVMDFRHFGVVAQVVRYEPRVSVSFFHADAQCFERPADHPAGMRVQVGADGASQRFDVFHKGF